MLFCDVMSLATWVLNHFIILSSVMSEKLRDVRLRDVGKYIQRNVSRGSVVGFPRVLSRWADIYRAKYVHVKNARMTPFFQIGGVIMLMNYMIDYRYNLKYEKMRKYH